MKEWFSKNETARARLMRLFDDGTFSETDRFLCDGDTVCSVVCGFGCIDGMATYAFAQDRSVNGGAVTAAHAAKIERVYQAAAKNGTPVIGLFDSDGVCVADGIVAMDGLSKILSCANTLSGVVPQIAVIVGSCVGSAALIAATADVTIAVKDADYYLTPDAPQSSLVTVDTEEEALESARRVLDYLPSNNLESPPTFESLPPKLSDTATVIDRLADTDSVYPLYMSENVSTVFAHIGGISCGIVAIEEDTVGDCTAAHVARFVRICDSFSLPIITAVDATAFASLNGAVKLGGAYAEATTAKITLITGKAYGSVYIAVAGKQTGADAVLAWDTASIAALDPLTAVHLLWTDRLKEMADPTVDRLALAEEYRLTECSAYKAAHSGAVTDVIGKDDTRQAIIRQLTVLAGKRVSTLPKKHSDLY